MIYLLKDFETITINKEDLKTKKWVIIEPFSGFQYQVIGYYPKNTGDFVIERWDGSIRGNPLY